MALQKRNLKEDARWLKWWIALLLICFTAGLSTYWGAIIYRDDMRRLELGAATDFDVLYEQLTQIEDAERIIVENIDRFNTLIDEGAMAAEDRVGLLERIRTIRDRHRLFPIDVEIGEQEQVLLEYGEEVEYPDEQLYLLNTRVRIRLPLLHEEDLTRFLGDFLESGHLMLSEQCVVNVTLADEEAVMELIEHQVATCDFVWYTFRRELYSEDDEYDEYDDYEE